MKKYILLAVMCIYWVSACAQTFDVDTLQYNGDIAKHINLVIMSDGYQESELPQFIADAQSFSNALFDERPFKEYAGLFNIFIIKVPSNESGADHPGTATDVTEPLHPVIDVDNYFGSTFDFANIHRLLVATNSANINSVLANNFPSYDQAFILVNSPHYGGSGGAIPVASTDASANEVAIHELGHSFASLSDEYWAGDQFAGETTNMTKETNPENVKWKNWYDDLGIGIYQHCCGGVSASWYKPHQNCKMQVLGQPFCAVCVEGIIEEIHFLTGFSASYLPIETDFPTPVFPLSFQAEVIEPVPATTKINWMLNGKSINGNTTLLELNESDLEVGENELKVIIHDTTTLLRIDGHETIHFSARTWTITGVEMVTGIENKIKLKDDIGINIYPNPSTSQFNVDIKGIGNTDVRLSLYNMQGQLIIEMVPTELQKQQELLTFGLAEFEGAMFLLKIIVDGNVLITKKLIRH